MILENSNTNSFDRCLIIPVAAKSLSSISKYVGQIVQSSKQAKWAIVQFHPLSPPNKLPVWSHPRASLISLEKQCWVHVDYTCYRKCYLDCFEDLVLNKMVIDHIRNRRFAKRLGFNYIRLVHVDRGINSSSGRGEEFDVVSYMNPEGLSNFKESPNEISYADPADLMKILNMKVGAFPLDNVRDNLNLFYN